MQNIFRKIKKSIKVRHSRKNFNVFFASFMSTSAKKIFFQGTMDYRLGSQAFKALIHFLFFIGFRILIYLKVDIYSDLSKRFKERVVKIIKSYKYFSKTFHLRSLARFCIRLSLKNDSLTCLVNLLTCPKFRHFKAYSRLIYTYLAIL